MKASNSILNLLNIRLEEAPAFFRLLVFTIFNGLGIALSFTTINVLVIEHHGIETLPYIYLFSSLILFIGGFIYARQENRQRPIKLLTTVMILAVVWAFSIRGLLYYGSTLGLIGFAFCTYYLVQLLTNLAFSTSAFILFDVRQGKRLFGPLAVGESFAQLIGYGLAPVIQSFFTIQDSLFVAGGSFVISWILLHRLIRSHSDQFDANRPIESDDDRLSLQTINFRHIINLFKSDAFARSVSILSIIAALLYFTIHYAFLDRLEFQFENLKDIAFYFSICLVVAQIINIMIKLFVASRVLNRFGVKIAILILPVFLMIINAAGLIGLIFGIHDLTFFIWIFGLSFLADEALRSSLYIPTYMTLFQPMARNRRRESHTLSKGIMEPLGIGIAGLIILLLKALGIFDLEKLTICILLFTGLWCLWSFKVIHAYLRLLYDALKFRILNKQSTELSRDEIQRLRSKFNQSRDPMELLYIANILEGRLSLTQQTFLVNNLLESDNETIQENGIRYIQENKMEAFIPQLRKYINGNSDQISARAIYTLAALREEDIVDEFDSVSFKSNEKQDAIIGATLKYGGLRGAVKTGQIFLEKIGSEKSADRIRAAKILGDIENPQYYHPIIKLLDDPDIDIQKTAIKAAGKIKQPKLLPHIIAKIDAPRLYADISKTCSNMREEVMPIIRSQAPNASNSTLKKYMALASKVGGKDAITFLISGLNSEEHNIRYAGINGLHKLKYRAGDDHNQLIIRSIDTIIDTINNINIHSDHKELNDAIFNEIGAILRPQMLKLLGSLYGHRVINKVSENLNIAEGDFRSNALELLENTISNYHSKRIIPLFEDNFIKASRNNETSSVKNATDVIFQASKGNISDWLKAMAIRVSRDLGIMETDHWIQKVRPIHSRILDEEVDLYIQQMS